MDITIADKAAAAAEIGQVLARAFHDDPVVEWLLPGGKGVQLLFVTLTLHSHDIAEIAREGDAIVGAALWDPPGHVPDEDGGIPGFVEAMGERVSYGMTLETTFAEHRPAAPHWYLAQIGTEPTLQGTGIGGALLRSGLARCDADGLPVYLESSKESNVPIYERYGFVVTGEIRLPDGPTVWGMWREPRVL